MPLLALFVQAFVPLRFPCFAVYFDLPLLVTIFFAMARRSPIAGLFTGAVHRLGAGHAGAQSHRDLWHREDGCGIRSIVSGSEARRGERRGAVPGHAGILSGAFGAVYFTVARGMVNMTLNWSWSHGILAGLANAVAGTFLYFVLDKFKQRT